MTTLIKRWNDSVGTYAEEYEYELLNESFLHQETILDVAYAVVPHLVAQLSRLDPDRCAEVFDDIALVDDEVRTTPRREVERRVAQMATMPEGLRALFMQNTRDRHPRASRRPCACVLGSHRPRKTAGGRSVGQGPLQADGAAPLATPRSIPARLRPHRR